MYQMVGCQPPLQSENLNLHYQKEWSHLRQSEFALDFPLALALALPIALVLALALARNADSGYPETLE